MGTVIKVTRGSVVVENPPRELLDRMRLFMRNGDGVGEYENLYSLSNSGSVMTTSPGFAERVMSICPNARIVNAKMPMPEPDVDSAKDGLDSLCAGIVEKSLKSGGGVVAIPDVIGDVPVIAAVLRAYRRNMLLGRGTPVSVVATNNRDSARLIAHNLRDVLRDRDIGVSTSGSYTDSEDVIVTTYGTLNDIPCKYTGVFIGTGLSRDDLSEKLGNVSLLRNAARWGVYSTPAGGFSHATQSEQMTFEGIFGPLSASASYSDSVDAGIGVPITVCWLPAPKPQFPLGGFSEDMVYALSMQENPEFVKMVAEIVARVRNDIGCLLDAEYAALVKRVSEIVPCAVSVSRKTPVKERRTLIADIASGTIRKALLTQDSFPTVCDHGVMVVGSCRKPSAFMCHIPWRRLKDKGDRAFMVDFRHDWDVHNGRPGYLLCNDDARVRLYREMKFKQITINNVCQLPFL